MRMIRRRFLLGCAAPLIGQWHSRLSFCSGAFAAMSFPEACKVTRRAGYAGIEIEPAHLGADPAWLSPAERREARRVVEGAGLRCVGLHGFLKTPPGFHLTTPDAPIRRKTWDYFARLIDLAADLTDRPVMVLGSSKQREAVDGATPQEAAQRLTDGLRALAPIAESRSVSVLVEPLAPHQCNVVTTLAEAMAIVRAVNSPAVQTIFDTHNTAAEKKPLDVLLRDYFPWIRHVHLNEMDGRRPGAGDFPFALVLRTLKELDYRGWISVEILDIKSDAEAAARLAYEYLSGLENRT